MSRGRILTITIKLAILALIVRELWLVIGISTISNSIISFFTIGLIPGTNTTLTPAEAYALAAAVSILTIGVMFRHELSRRLVGKTVTQEPITAEPIIDDIKLPAPRPYWLLLFAYSFNAYSGKLAQYIVKYMLLGMAFLVNLTKMVTVMSIDFWHKIEPDLWRIDAWLEKQFHKFKPTARLLGVTNALIGFFMRQIGHYTQIIQELKKGERRF